MKHLFHIFSLLFFLTQCASPKLLGSPLSNSNQDDLQMLWIEIDSLEKVGLFSSALTLLDSLQVKAQELGAKNHMVKALFYKGKYYTELKEYAAETIIQEFESALLDEKDFSYKKIYHSILGELYYNYASQNQYKFNQRTSAEIKGEGISTWSIQQIVEKSNAHFENSVQDLTHHDLELDNYKLLLAPFSLDNSSFDLYSLLLMRAIKHFQNDRNLISEPVYTFTLDDEDAFGSVEDFIQLDFNTEDNNSYRALALNFYQHILEYHKDDKLIDRLDVDRLNYVKRIHRSELRDSLYKQKVQQMSKTSNHATFAYAHVLFTQSDAESKRSAHSIVTRLVNSDIDKDLKSRASAYLKSVERPYLNVSVEQVYIPNEKALFQISFNNISELQFSIHPVNEEILEKLRNRKDGDEQVSMIKSIKAQQSWDRKLPDSNFSLLSSELLFPELPVGRYILLTTTDDIITFNIFQVSHLTYYSSNTPEGLEVIVADRKTGQAKENVNVTFFSHEYRNRENEKLKIAEQKSDKNGRVFYDIPNSKQLNYTSIKLELDNDVLEFRDLYSKIWGYRSQSNSRIYTFTDRNLYRPNQRVYAKAIVMKSDDDLIQNGIVKIVVRDPNGREIYQQDKVSNEYGSVVFDFLLPNEGVTGYFNIELETKDNNAHGYINFQVEEYKRPSFLIEVDEPTTKYSLEDSLIVQGRTLMFSGPAVPNAQIEYRITRNQYHYFHWFQHNRRGIQNGGAEIDNGLVKTNANGEFEIPFILNGGSGSNQQQGLVYLFNIELKATDISGETQYFSKQIKVSQKSLFVTTNLKDEIKLSDLDSIQVYSKNINGIDIPFNGKIVIESLEAPVTFKREKYRYIFSHSDTTLLSDEEYALVPFDYKLHNNDPNNWAVKQEIYSQEFRIRSVSYSVSVGSIPQDTYHKVTIFNLDTGESEYEKIIRIIDPENNYIDAQKLFSYTVNQAVFTPGEKVVLNLLSANKGLEVYYQLEKNSGVLNKGWIKLSSSDRRIRVPVNEGDRGGFSIHLVSFYNNRFQKEEIDIQVPHSNKKLRLKLNSFKSTLDVGSEEEWTITIKDEAGKSVTAELLASMYDSSLDALYTEYDWQKINYYKYYSHIRDLIPGYRLLSDQFLRYIQNSSNYNPLEYYPDLNSFGYYGGNQMFRPTRGVGMKSSSRPPAAMRMDAGIEAPTLDEVVINNSVIKGEVEWSQVRNMLDETVFFYPDLVTNENGEVGLKFKMSDALSSWKLQLFAHDKDGRHVLESYKLKSIKQLAVYPNVPRFLRVDDQLDLSGKIVNSTDENILPTVTIQFLNPDTNEDVTKQVVSSKSSYALNVDAQSSSKINWEINVNAEHLSGLIYRIHVGSENGSDAIQGFIPITTNQVLITESLPIYVKGKQENKFVFEDLEQVLESNGATLSKYVLEYTSNPSWYVIQALPFLTNPSLNSSINVSNQYAANCIGKSLVKARPELKSTLENWSRTNSTEFKSSLEKNQDLKNEKLINTPWLRQSQTESEQKKQIIRFFSENTINTQLDSSLSALLERQNSDGGFSWISENRSNVYSTSLILENIGRLQNLNIPHDIPLRQIQMMVDYVDNELDKINKGDSKIRSYANHLQLLYARSFFIDYDKISTTYLSGLNKISQNLLDRELYEQAMIATILYRVSKTDEANRILESLQEQVIRTENIGSYWKRNRQYFSNQSSIDKHVMMIELYYEMGVDQEQIDELRIWLLRNKQTNHWKNVKSTSSAVYAFLLHNSQAKSDWLRDSRDVTVTVGDDVLQSKKEEGTLYMRHDFDPQIVKAQSSIIQIKNPNEQAGWGAAYIQYYDDIKNIENNSLAELSIKKEIFKKTLGPTGPILEPVDNIKLIQGDQLVVRLELQNDRSLEYVHVRDERASGLEPVNVISSYKSQDALSYYEVTRDDSSNFYMSRLPKGTHVFEYELTVNLNGSFSSGMATAQCIYAPEFIAHSNTIHLHIKP